EERLHAVQLLDRRVVVRDRRHPEVRERVHERCAAEAAAASNPAHDDWTGAIPGAGASENSSICRSECSRRSAPDWNALYQDTIVVSAWSRSHRGTQPSRTRAFEESSRRYIASCGLEPPSCRHGI